MPLRIYLKKINTIGSIPLACSECCNPEVTAELASIYKTLCKYQYQQGKLSNF